MAALTACDIWLHLLKENQGLPFNFILGRLLCKRDELFVDASEKGYGGLCDTSFSKYHIRLLKLHGLGGTLFCLENPEYALLVPRLFLKNIC